MSEPRCSCWVRWAHQIGCELRSERIDRLIDDGAALLGWLNLRGGSSSETRSIPERADGWLGAPDVSRVPVTMAPAMTSHVHEWERGAHMAAAFGVDGRRYYCAICGIPYWCMAQTDTLTVCDIHGGPWPEGAKYCDAHGPDYRWVP